MYWSSGIKEALDGDEQEEYKYLLFLRISTNNKFVAHLRYQFHYL